MPYRCRRTAAEVAHEQAVVERVLRARANRRRGSRSEPDRAALWYGLVQRPQLVVQSAKAFSSVMSRCRANESRDAGSHPNHCARHRDGLLFIAVRARAATATSTPRRHDKDNPLAASALEAANNEIIEAALHCGPSPVSMVSEPRRSRS